MERLNEGIKRRTRVVRIFPNADPCLRLVTALCVEQSEEWVSGRRYLETSGLCQAMAREETFADKPQKSRPGLFAFAAVVK